MGSNNRYSRMTREELLAEIHAVQATVGDDRSLQDVLQELRVHQEEVEVQQGQLLEAHRAVEESRDRYADLYDFAPIAFVTLDRTGLIQEANLAAATLLSVERARLVGFPLLVYVADRDRRSFLDHLARCRTSDEIVRTRLHLRTRAGIDLLVELVSRAGNESSKAAAWYTGLVDLTDSERADAQRRAIELDRLRLQHEEQTLRAASATKDRFLAVLSHELRTPLTPILLKLGALEARGSIPPELREPLTLVRRNIEHEARLIDDLLDTTRIVHGKLRMDETCVDIHALIEDLLATAASEVQAAGLDLRVDLAATEHHVQGDALRLRQVFWNLLSNAQRHTPAGGSLAIATVNRQAGCLTIVVSDTGAGIDPGALDRMFEPFEQAPGATRAGLGLGLAISKGIIEAHQGRIHARSEGPDRGTTIEIDLGTISADRAGGAADAEPAPVRTDTLRILLVEDHPDSADSLRELLLLYGHQVELARSFTDALEHRGKSFDLLITDLGLPDGDGVHLLRELGESRPSHSIALSGFGAEHDVTRCRDAGFDCHLTKPVEIDTLLRTVDTVMKQSSTRAARIDA